MAKKRKKPKIRQQFLLALDAVLVLALIICSILLISSLVSRKKSRALYERTVSEVVSTPAPASPTPFLAPEETPLPSPETTHRSSEEVPVTVDFEALAEESRHVLGWLYSADTPINYPLVQRDDNEYYLTHAYNGSKRKSGALFFDCRNASDLSDPNLILYGHHMADDSMFGTLLNYSYFEEYYAQHPLMYLITPTQDYRVEIFAARTMNSNAENYPIWFSSEEEHRVFINRCINNSLIQADTDVAENAQTIMLVTCTYTGTFSDAKFILYGELVPLGI